MICINYEAYISFENAHYDMSSNTQFWFVCHINKSSTALKSLNGNIPIYYNILYINIVRGRRKRVSFVHRYSTYRLRWKILTNLGGLLPVPPPPDLSSLNLNYIIPHATFKYEYTERNKPCLGISARLGQAQFTLCVQFCF